MGKAFSLWECMFSVYIPIYNSLASLGTKSTHRSSFNKNKIMLYAIEVYIVDTCLSFVLKIYKEYSSEVFLYILCVVVIKYLDTVS